MKYLISTYLNNYTMQTCYMLTCNDVVINGNISSKNINAFLKRGIALSDSKGIEKYLQYNNL